MKSRTLVFLIAAAMTLTATAQNIQYGESFGLNSPLSPTQVYEYTANNYIDLNSGFHSEPKIDYYTTLQLDPYGIYPPEVGLTGGPNTSDKGVVGALGGVVDVGAMGAAIYSIPIEVPQGINGMQPSLSITYNSQAGNGLLGWGWDITGLSSIERTGKTRYHDGVVGTVTMDDKNDRLVLDGVRLIKVADYSDSIEYKTEQDGMSKIMAYYAWLPSMGKENTEPLFTISHFKIWKADGYVLEYGGSDNSRLTLQNSGPKAFGWHLSRMTDRNGNSVVFHYNKSASTGEIYISSIDYTEHSENGTVIKEPGFTVDFYYRSGYTQDYDFKYEAGNILQKRKLLDHISINNNESDTELEAYSFKYKTDSIGPLYGYVRMHNRLKEIILEKEGTTLNPTRITWSCKENDYNENIFLYEWINDTAIYKNIPFVGDFNGDGYSDLAIVPHMDSVYTHNIDVKFFLNNPSNPGHFIPNTALTIHNVDKRLDWLYPVDLNDDGMDDLVAYFYDSIVATAKDTTAIIIFENLGGDHFESRDTIGIMGSRFLVRMGDFLGNGKTQLLLMPVLSSPLSTWTFSRLVYHDGNTLQKVYSNSIFYNVRDVAIGDFDGDGRSEILIVKENSSTVYSLGMSNNTLIYNTCFSTSDINHFGCWNHVFTGDFNGDGKTDILYNDRINNNNSRWNFFYSTGESFIGTGGATALATYNMPAFNLYSNSLRKLIDGFTENGYGGVWNSSLCVADFDGDGISDVARISMNASSSSITIYTHYNPLLDKFNSFFIGGSAIHEHYYFNCRSQYLHVGNFKGKDNLSFLGLEYRNTPHTNNRPGVFSLKPASELNSVSVVVDGMDNPVGFGYGYVQQPYQDFNYGVRRLPVPVRVITSTTNYNATDNQMREYISYSDPLYHRDGHGWLGFRKQTRRMFKNGVETDSIVSTHSLGTMTSHAMLLPEADSAYVFPEEGSAVLSSVTSYQFEKVRSNYGSINTDRLVVCPALTEKAVVRYDPDNPGAVLSKTFTENHYNYTNGFYYHTYHCDSIMTGVGDYTVTGLNGCAFMSKEKTDFYYNDYATWTINKPHVQTWTQSGTGKPDVKNSRWIEYPSIDSYLPSRIYDVPGGVSSQNPLKLQTDYEYYPDGNLRRKTVRVPNGQLGEQQKTVEYDYGPGDQQRLVTKETVSSGDLSYETSYSYDLYDRVDTLTSANGLATTFDNDAFGVTSWTKNADNTQSCTARRWASGHPLKPQGALYYTWERSSDGRQNLVFFHKTGTELRSVAYGIHGEPIITDKRYDSRGRLSAVSDPYKEGETPRWTIYGYDNLDRLESVTTPDTTVTSIVHDGFRTETTVTTPQGLTQESATVVNAMGWTVRCEDASGSHVVFDHYADGLMATATVNDNAAATVTATYDDARRKSTVTDPDYGTLTTVYDAYGRLKRSVSPRELAGQAETVNYYDGLDRVYRTTDGLENTRTDYDYNETGVLKGTLDEIRFKIQNGADIQRINYTYDALARPVQVTEQRTTGTYATTMAYDSQSRVIRLTYPSGMIVRYGYHHGYLNSISDNDGRLLWKTNDINACGQLLEAELGNGAVTRYTYDTIMHRLNSIVTTKNLQHLTYNYDNFGNLASRKDNQKNLEETFTYDDMNRLTDITLKRPSGQDLYCSATYDALGRMTSKEAVTKVNNVPQVTTVFSLPVFDNTKVHALSQAQTAEGVFPSTDQIVTYTGFDKVSKVKQGTDSLCYAYGYDRQRISMEEHVGNTTRTKRYVGNCEYVTETTGGYTETQWLTYLSGPTGVFAVMAMEGGDAKTHYILKDNLGSWTTITDEEGSVEQNLSYDAWGNLRNPNTWTNYTASDSFEKPMFDRGYTGHEHLAAFGLVNMNGRMYDPVMSSFLSADRYVQDPLSAQGFNRYAYCLYNPLRYVDPTGWRSGSGGGHSSSGPINRIIINGHIYNILPEVTVTDNPSLSNTYEYEEYEYTPNNTSGGFDNGWGNSNGWSSGGHSGGSGGGCGNHGGGNQSGIISIEIQKTIMNYVVQYELFNIALGNKIASYAGSDFNKKMFLNYWFGKGDYELSSSEFEDIVSLSIQTKKPYLSEWNGDPAFAAPVTLYGTTYANAIGTTTLFYDLNGNAIGIHESYDFNLFPIRDSMSAQIKTTLVWSASLYNVHDKDFFINYNYHP